MRKSKLLVIRSNQFKKFSNKNNFRAPLRDPFFKTQGRYLVKIHHFFVGVKFMTLSYFFIKRSYFSIPALAKHFFFCVKFMIYFFGNQMRNNSLFRVIPALATYTFTIIPDVLKSRPQQVFFFQCLKSHVSSLCLRSAPHTLSSEKRK